MRRPREDGRIEVGPQEGVAHLVVSREQLRRALLVMQAIFGEARLRGYGVQPIPKDGYGARAGVGVAIRGHAYTIEVTELTDQVPLSEEEVEAWRRQQEGRVRFSWEKGKEPPTHKHVANGKPPRVLAIALERRSLELE